LTHIGEDAAATAYAVSEQATVHVKVAAVQATVLVRQLSVKTLQAAAPHVDKSKKLIYEHVVEKVKPHYEQHVKPHYDKYAAPAVTKAAVLGEQCRVEYVVPAMAVVQDRAIQSMDKIQQESQKQFHVLLAMFAKECPKALSAAKSFAKDKDITLPNFIVKEWNSVCNHPQESITTLLQATAILLVLLFRRTIFRTVMWLIRLPFRIVVFVVFFPLQLLFGSKKKTTRQQTTTTTTTRTTKNATNNGAKKVTVVKPPKGGIVKKQAAGNSQ
jgi:hypothetical protein